MIKKKSETNEIKTEKSIQNISKTKSCFFKNKLDLQALAKLRKSIQINTIRNDKEALWLNYMIKENCLLSRKLYNT